MDKKKKKYLMHHFPSRINEIYANVKLTLDSARGYKKMKNLFERRMGYKLNLDDPQSFNEKIFWKKLNDRNPLLTDTADKLKAREYVQTVLGKAEAEKILIPVYYSTSNPENIPFDELPDKFVVKPNHGSAMHIIVREKKPELTDVIVKECKKWLRQSYGIYQYEWAYKKIKKKIIIEKLVQAKCGNLPHDYKLYCIHGLCKLIRVSKNRFGKEIAATYFDLQWNALPVVNPGFQAAKEKFEKPARFKELIEIAEKLSKEFDQVRVDFFISDENIYFVEFTHYDGTGLTNFEPTSFDFELGRHWEIKPNYWVK